MKQCVKLIVFVNTFDKRRNYHIYSYSLERGYLHEASWRNGFQYYWGRPFFLIHELLCMSVWSDSTENHFEALIGIKPLYFGFFNQYWNFEFYDNILYVNKLNVAKDANPNFIHQQTQGDKTSSGLMSCTRDFYKSRNCTEFYKFKSKS